MAKLQPGSLKVLSPEVEILLNEAEELFKRLKAREDLPAVGQKIYKDAEEYLKRRTAQKDIEPESQKLDMEADELAQRIKALEISRQQMESLREEVKKLYQRIKAKDPEFIAWLLFPDTYGFNALRNSDYKHLTEAEWTEMRDGRIAWRNMLMN